MCPRGAEPGHGDGGRGRLLRGRMKDRYRILAIVEGHGEVRAVPALLRRWFQHRRFRNFETPSQAIRAPGAGALKCAHDAVEDLGIESFVEVALAQRGIGNARTFAPVTPLGGGA